MRYSEEKTTWLCSELVTLVYENGTERRETIANLEQISRSSAVLLTDATIEKGCYVSFAAQAHELSGRVADRVYDQLLGCFLTVELDHCTLWSPEWFRPEHLLRVDELPLVTASAA